MNQVCKLAEIHLFRLQMLSVWSYIAIFQFETITAVEDDTKVCTVKM